MTLPLPTFLTNAAAASALRAVLGKADSLPGCDHAPPPLPPPAPAPGPLKRLLRAFGNLQRLDPSRYDNPWVLLVGEPGAGKSSLAASVPVSQRAGSEARSMAGAAWIGLEQGTLIDVDGKLAPVGSKPWQALLREVDGLRPERPVDGVLLVVSARTLAGTDVDAAARIVRAQLDAIQSAFAFTLPVYVVVTHSDTVPGFGAFWRALDSVTRNEMVGWSAPALPDGGSSAEWAQHTFDLLATELRALQIRAAARATQLDDADEFFLFPRHLQGLRAPLVKWLAIVFQPGYLAGGFAMRGIYFTGSVDANGADSKALRTDVSFVGDLIGAKVLAERHLARPARNSIWARNRLLRSLQLALAAGVAALALLLCSSSYALIAQRAELTLSLNAVQNAAALPVDGTCLEKAQAYDLLAKINNVHASLDYAPWSWLDRGPRTRAGKAIADTALAKVIVPGLRCQLSRRADELRTNPALPVPLDKPPADAANLRRQDLFTYLDQLIQLETNAERLQKIANHAAPAAPKAAAEGLSALAEYLYGSPPPGARRVAYLLPDWLLHALDTALKAVGITTKPTTPNWHVDGDSALLLAMRELHMDEQEGVGKFQHQKLQERINELSGRLDPQLQEDVASGQKRLAALVIDANQAAAPGFGVPLLREHARQALEWLAWIRTDWLSSSEANNPCQIIAAGLDQRSQALAGKYELKAAKDKFAPRACYTAAMKSLHDMSVPGIGSVIIRGTPDTLNPNLEPERDGLAALIKQEFMQASAISAFSCSPTLEWAPATIRRAVARANEYQQFAKARVPDPRTGAAPLLYASIALRQLELAMTSALNDAQQSAPPSSGASDSRDASVFQASTRFQAAAPALAEVLARYREFGFSASEKTLASCVNTKAAAVLGAIDALAVSSDLYQLPAPAGYTPSEGKLLFDLGGDSALDMYLTQQLARVQVLAGYAAPFKDFPRPSGAPPQYTNWNGTIRELNQLVGAHDTAGQAGKLHDLFRKQLLVLDTVNCKDKLPAVLPDDEGDLFSARRRQAVELAQARCGTLGDAKLVTDYAEFAAQFNRELSGHYPFGAIDSTEATLASVRRFFNTYGPALSSLRARVDKRPERRWAARRAFLAQLDGVAASLRPLLAAAPVTLTVDFNTRPADAAGAEQLVNWTLTSGARSIGWPNRPPSKLDWTAGQVIEFDLEWASLSPWRPMRDGNQGELQVDGASASFAYSGDWALLRMLGLHKDDDAGTLAFRVPVAASAAGAQARASGQARVYMTVKLATSDPGKPAPVSLTLPAALPTSAPQ